MAQGQDGGMVSVDAVLKILGQSRERQQVLGKCRRGSRFFLGGEPTGGLQRTGVLRWVTEKQVGIHQAEEGGHGGHFRREEEHFHGDGGMKDHAVFGDPGIMCWRLESVRRRVGGRCR